MARIISYPIISTVSSGDLIPISDTSDANRPLYNVEVSKLSDFFNENGFWAPIVGGINYSGGNVSVAGSIQSPRFDVGSSNASYLRDNAGDTELFADGNLILSTADGIGIEISDVIDISGAGEINCGNPIIATSFVKAGGTSSQFLKADGSADSDIILVSPDGTEYRLVVANGGALSTVAV